MLWLLAAYVSIAAHVTLSIVVRMVAVAYATMPVSVIMSICVIGIAVTVITVSMLVLLPVIYGIMLDAMISVIIVSV